MTAFSCTVPRTTTLIALLLGQASASAWDIDSWDVNATPSKTESTLGDAYNLDWVHTPPPPAEPLSRKRGRSLPGMSFAAPQVPPVKRARSSSPQHASWFDKENVAQVEAYHAEYSMDIPVPSRVYRHKGIGEIDLLVGGETAESICGGPVVLPDFADTVLTNAHVSHEPDEFGCFRVTRKLTKANAAKIIAMVQSKLRLPGVSIPSGGALDDAVVFERVKQVATLLAGTSADLFMQNVYLQQPATYIRNTNAHRDYIENWHYRYLTRHMWFEIRLLDVLRKHYPRRSRGGGPTAFHANAAHALTTDDSYNISDQQEGEKPRGDFQAELIAVLEEHLHNLPDPVRLNKTSKANPLEHRIAQAMYGHGRHLSEANMHELIKLATLHMKKDYSRLQALHIVLQLEFRFVLHARYVLFMEHSGAITMNGSETAALHGNVEKVIGLLKSESKFMSEAPAMFSGLMNLIERSGLYRGGARQNTQATREYHSHRSIRQQM